MEQLHAFVSFVSLCHFVSFVPLCPSCRTLFVERCVSIFCKLCGSVPHDSCVRSGLCRTRSTVALRREKNSRTTISGHLNAIGMARSSEDIICRQQGAQFPFRKVLFSEYGKEAEERISRAGMGVGSLDSAKQRSWCEWAGKECM